MFDPERDEEPGARRFYLRLLAVAAVTAVVCAVLWPSVHGFAAGPDHDTGCLAITDGWHGDRSGPNQADVRAAYAAYPAVPTEAQRNDPAFMAHFRAQLQALAALPVVQQANSYADWRSGPGACVHESRHRLILSGIGLAVIAFVLSVGTFIVRRTRKNLRPTPAELAGV